MNVRDLIALLSQEDPEAPVVRARMHDGKVEGYEEYRGFDTAEGLRREQPLSREPYWRVPDRWSRRNERNDIQELVVL